MKFKVFLGCSVAIFAAAPTFGEEKRELDAHEHGHGNLNIAVEGRQISIELEVPGFDIVGFEHEAESEEDKEKVTTALATLSDPMNMFVFPKNAGCEVSKSEIELHGDDKHHESHDGEHDHEEHAEHEHEEHSEHNGHAKEETHSEFHAEYLLTCADVAQVTTIELPYFAIFENAEELEVQLVTDKGAVLMEATPEDPILDLAQAM